MTELHVDAAVSVDEESPPRDPMLLRIGARLLAKAERSGGERAVRLRLDRREFPELYDQVHAEALVGSSCCCTSSPAWVGFGWS
jgi:hypothetical protein